MSYGEFTYQQLDDSIFEHIRRQVVAQGYYPDLYLYQPNNTVGFNAALDAIKVSGSPVINTVGVGSFINKGETQLNTIYIHRNTTSKGSVALQDTAVVRTDGLTTPPTASTTYELVKGSGFTQNVEYEVRFICTDQKVADSIHNVLMLALTMGTEYFDIYDLDTQSIVPNKRMLLSFNGNIDLNLYEAKEYLFRFEVLNAWIVTGATLPNGVEKTINPNIVPITDIQRDLNTQ